MCFLNFEFYSGTAVVCYEHNGNMVLFRIWPIYTAMNEFPYCFLPLNCNENLLFYAFKIDGD